MTSKTKSEPSINLESNPKHQNEITNTNSSEFTNDYLKFGEEILNLKIPITFKKSGDVCGFAYWYTLTGGTDIDNIISNSNHEYKQTENVSTNQNQECSTKLPLHNETKKEYLNEYENNVTNQCVFMIDEIHSVTEKTHKNLNLAVRNGKFICYFN